MSTGESAGYLAVNKDQGRLIIMFEVQKGDRKYAWVDLDVAADVVTGKRANCAIWRRKK